MTNPNPSPELLPCPFCGGEAAIQLDRGRNTVGVGCTQCTACQPPSWDIASETWARHSWNTRALSQTLPAPGGVERKQFSHEDRVASLACALAGIAKEAEEEHGEWTWREIATAAMNILWCKPGQSLATVAAANDEGVARIELIARVLWADGQRRLKQGQSDLPRTRTDFRDAARALLDHPALATSRSQHEGADNG